MRRSVLFLCVFFALTFVSCAKGPKPIPTWKDPDVNGGDEDVPAFSDMVLIYGGGHHRTPYAWTPGILKDYVICFNKGKWHWLFDSFLMLEFMDPAENGGAGKTFITGYKYKGNYMPSANKKDWENLINYYFSSSSSGAGAIDMAIEEAKSVMGEPKEKRAVVVGIPEPITVLYSATNSGGSTYWGEIAGDVLDFKESSDRIRACKWYIDTVIKKFKDMNYKNIQLAGFYWVAEKSTHTNVILNPIADYIKAKKYVFNWIPYYNAEGFSLWKSFGFNYAYLQPNYFFRDDVPYSRLNDACAQAKSYGMGLELEFDNNALKSYGKAYKLRDYMRVFKECGVWENSRLAYYQGSWSLRALKYSSEQEDKDLYHDFCEFVISRPIRNVR